MVENDVSMISKIMNLFAKRSRSKAHSAAPLPSGRFVNLRRISFDFLHSPYNDTVSQESGRGRGGNLKYFCLDLLGHEAVFFIAARSHRANFFI